MAHSGAVCTSEQAVAYGCYPVSLARPFTYLELSHPNNKCFPWSDCRRLRSRTIQGVTGIRTQFGATYSSTVTSTLAIPYKVRSIDSDATLSQSSYKTPPTFTRPNTITTDALWNRHGANRVRFDPPSLQTLFCHGSTRVDLGHKRSSIRSLLEDTCRLSSSTRATTRGEKPFM